MDIRDIWRVLNALSDRTSRREWSAVAALAVVVTFLEAVSALAVFAVLRLVADPDADARVPILGDLRDRLPHSSTESLVAVMALAVAGLFAVRGVLLFVNSQVQHRVAQRIGVRLSTRLLRGYLHLPYSEYLSRNSAELMRTISETVNNSVAYVLMPLSLIFSEGLVMIVLMAIVISTSPLVGLVSIGVAVPGLVLLLRIVQPRLARAGAENEAGLATTYRASQQSLQGAREVRVGRHQPYFVARFESERQRLARAWASRGVLIDIPRILIETVLVIGVLLTLAAISLARSGPEGLAVMGLVAYAVLRIMPSLNRLTHYLNQIKFGLESARIVRTELSVIPPEASEEVGRPLELTSELSIEHVSYAYPDGTAALRDTTFQVRHGTSVGLVGPTGGGKTTLVDIVAGLLSPTSGRVLVDGHDIAECLPRWQQSVGLVPQSVYLIDETIRRNIAFGIEDADIDDTRVWEALELAQLDDFVRVLAQGLDTEVGERGVRISGGQRQRLAIARALYPNPPILLLDEGTSALDNLTEAELVQALDELKGDRTIITVAHRLSTVEKCDRIFLIEGGALTGEGSFDELIAQSQTFRDMARTTAR